MPPLPSCTNWRSCNLPLPSIVVLPVEDQNRCSPELSRTLARQHGVDVILHPTAFCRDETFHTWQAFATTRALENQVYFASVNRAGDSFGGSMLVEPWMDETVPLRRLSNDETFARWTLSRSVLDHARANYPFLADARDDYDTLAKARLRG